MFDRKRHETCTIFVLCCDYEYIIQLYSLFNHGSSKWGSRTYFNGTHILFISPFHSVLPDGSAIIRYGYSTDSVLVHTHTCLKCNENVLFVRRYSRHGMEIHSAGMDLLCIGYVARLYIYIFSRFSELFFQLNGKRRRDIRIRLGLCVFASPTDQQVKAKYCLIRV